MKQISSRSFAEVFIVFFKLGLTSFGGPIAHLGYFMNELVRNRRWISEEQYAQLIALCQFLPGPASSQMGFSLGLLRAGWAGAIAAFIAFTLPSALLMFGFAILLPNITGVAGSAAIHGLKLVALAVVAHAVLGMGRQLCPDTTRLAIASIAAIVILFTDHAWIQLLAVLAGAVAGFAVCHNVKPVTQSTLETGISPKVGGFLLLVFALLLAGLPFFARDGNSLVAIAEAFYRAGALVFGGGHVVLPLLEETVVKPGWISQDEFLAGYGAAQAVPGPMFTFAAFLGARLPEGIGMFTGAGVAVTAIFLPGFLLLSGVLPLWHAIASGPVAARAVAGVNAAVVGLLAAALYDPVWTSAVRTPIDIVVALVGFVMLVAWKLSPLLVVLWCVLASVTTVYIY